MTDKSSERELITRMFSNYEDLAIGDIDRALSGKCVLGALILAACFVDYEAKMLGVLIGKIGRENSKLNYIEFMKRYMQQYDGLKIYEDLRCELVHAYTGQGEYIYVSTGSEGHLARATSHKKTVIDVETFIGDVKAGFVTFRDSILSDSEKVAVLYMSLKAKYLGFLEVQEVEYPVLESADGITIGIIATASSTGSTN